jgi:hypothetical protein
MYLWLKILIFLLFWHWQKAFLALKKANYIDNLAYLVKINIISIY